MRSAAMSSKPSGRLLELLGPSTGGIRRHVAVLAQMLNERGWDATVAGPDGVVDGLGVAAEVVSVPASMSPRKLLTACRQLRSLGRFDLVHAHGLKAGWVAVLARTRGPIVLTIHNVVLDEVAGRSAAVQRRLERLLIGRVDQVIAVSPEIVRHFAGVVAGDRIRFVIPASPAPVPRRSRSEVRSGLGISSDAVLVVVVARLHPQKDLPMFIDAWARVAARHPEARAIIVGGGPLYDELADLVQSRGLGGSLQLIGASDHAVDELSAGDIMALSSRWEGAPLVVAEAMQLGLPIVSTDVGVVAEMVGNGGCIVEVGDSHALADGLSAYIESWELREGAGQISRERGTVIYGAGPLVDEITGIYQEVLAR